MTARDPADAIQRTGRAIYQLSAAGVISLREDPRWCFQILAEIMQVIDFQYINIQIAPVGPQAGIPVSLSGFRVMAGL